MQPDLQKMAEAREWLQRVLADLESATVLIRSTPAHPRRCFTAGKRWNRLHPVFDTDPINGAIRRRGWSACSTGRESS